MENVKALIQASPNLQLVMNTLEDAGHDVHLVGGAVRNVLLGLPAKDLDLATSAHPEAVTALFQAASHSVHPTGIEHGTVTVVVNEEPFEVTTWRRDVATDGRRAAIAFADTMVEDAVRRDFTMNALYADKSGEVFDPTGQGLEDISARRIRFIADPVERVREDSLRILRYFRFAAAYAGGPDKNSPAFKVCKDQHQLVDQLSKERIGMEMRKIITGANAPATLRAMNDAGVLSIVSPDIDPRKIDTLASLEELEEKTSREPCLVRRLTLLCEETPKVDLDLRRTEARRHAQLVGAFKKDLPLAELGYRFGEFDGLDLMLLHEAAGKNWSVDAPMDVFAAATRQVFPVAPKDLLPFIKGKELGDALRKAEDEWIASGFGMPKDDLMKSLGIPL